MARLEAPHGPAACFGPRPGLRVQFQSKGLLLTAPLLLPLLGRSQENYSVPTPDRFRAGRNKTRWLSLLVKLYVRGAR